MHEDNPYLLPDRVYTVLKWLGLIALPAVAWCISVIAPAWGLPYADQIVTTGNEIGTLIGILIGASAIKASKNQDAETCFFTIQALMPLLSKMEGRGNFSFSCEQTTIIDIIM